VETAVTVDRSFRFVSDEEMAAAQDEQSEEDVLVLSRSFDLVELVEDELLMEMPLAPRHEVCPEPVKLTVADEAFDTASAERENPFALLAKLKIGKTGAK
jgi:Predicted metal-binding, possibly nucleic acid-binding protein